MKKDYLTPEEGQRLIMWLRSKAKGEPDAMAITNAGFSTFEEFAIDCDILADVFEEAEENAEMEDDTWPTDEVWENLDDLLGDDDEDEICPGDEWKYS
jgi:hypothetical protein